MTLRLEDKQAIVAEVAEVANTAISAVVAEYRGLSVAEMTELRSKARAANVYLRVVRNTLARRAVADTEFACLQESLIGPVMLAFSRQEPSAAAKVIRDFAKEHELLIAKAISLNGEVLDGKALAEVAKLPTKEEAISQLLSVLQAPISKFVRTLAEPHTKLVRTFKAVADAKQEQV